MWNGADRGCEGRMQVKWRRRSGPAMQEDESAMPNADDYAKTMEDAGRRW